MTEDHEEPVTLPDDPDLINAVMVAENTSDVIFRFETLSPETKQLVVDRLNTSSAAWFRQGNKERSAMFRALADTLDNFI